MKNIKNFINERLHITSKQHYSCQPKTKDELQKIIIERIKKEGMECDLNDIDVSKIIDMSHLFDAGDWLYGDTIFKDFNGDISLWNVSNVTNMYAMFNRCEKFNCDLSDWDVSNVEDMGIMFNGCEKFNGDLSRWDVSKVKTIAYMFHECKKFNCDLSHWNMSNVENMYNAFLECPTQPKLYKLYMIKQRQSGLTYSLINTVYKRIGIPK